MRQCVKDLSNKSAVSVSIPAEFGALIPPAIPAVSIYLAFDCVAMASVALSRSVWDDVEVPVFPKVIPHRASLAGHWDGGEGWMCWLQR